VASHLSNRIPACLLKGFIKSLIIVTTSFPKSLLTSFFQREEIPLFEKEGTGEILPEMSILF
jgi:hypothetical protein